MKNIIIIYGPTASGKTKFSYKFIEFLKNNYQINNNNLLKILKDIYPKEIINIENNNTFLLSGINPVIINMDSKQIYYNLPSLTASPDIIEKNYCYHYLFNQLNCWDSLTVDIWAKQVRDFIDNTNFDLYIIIGGSNFYLKYFLTNEYCYSYNGYSWDKLINIFLKFPWSFILKYFNNNRFKPNVNDNFRKFNFIKQYFWDKYNKILLTYKLINNIGYVINSIGYTVNIIIINPNLCILKKNIINRVNQLNIHKLLNQYNNISNYDFHKNFYSIIGINLLKNINKDNNFDINSFVINNLQYCKSQKKWINYFLNHKFFNYSYYYCTIDEI
jgi:tRNA A37 N6-isopentenylltransferase MiaA